MPAIGWRPWATWPTRPPGRRRTSRARSRSRCWSRGRPASGRPSWPRRWRARRAPTWCDCSATRGSTRRGRSTSGTTRSSCSGSRPPATRPWEQTHDDIFTEEFLLTRPLLTAIRREEPTVLLVDEVDKTDVEVEGLLLEILSDFQVTIPELGTVAAVRLPYVVLTSNASRELSEALKRRCLYLHLDYPDAERECEIIRGQVPDLDDADRPAGRRDGRPAARPGAEEVAVDRRVRRLGAHPGGAGDRRPRRGRRRRARWASCSSTPPTTTVRSRSSGCRDELQRPAHHAHRLPRGAARSRCAGLARRGSRRDRRASAARLGRPRRDPAGVRRHAGQAAGAAADLRHALRPLLPAPGRRGRGSGTGSHRRSNRRRTLGTRRWTGARRLAEALADRRRRRRWRSSPREAVGAFGAMPRARAGPVAAGRRTRRCNGVSPADAGRAVVAALLADGPRRGRPARRGGPPRRRVRPAVEADARRRIAAEKGPDHVARVAVRPTHRPARLHLRAPGRPRRDATRDLPAGPAPRDPARPRAARPAPRPARLPAYRARLDLDRRRPAGHPPQAEATAPHRAGRALRRERLGGELRPVHADAGLRPARAVREGAGVHLRRPGARGDRPLPARSRPGRRDGRARGRAPRTPRCGGAPTTAGRSRRSPRSTPTRSARRSSLLVLGDARSNYSDLALPTR